MGITGLLPFVKNSCRPANIRDFAGSSVAIDAYSWLHKGAFACAEKLVKGEKTDGYVFYCIKYLNMLIDAGVTPIMVFDGCNLASKAGTEKKRRENREKTKQRGKELLCEGKIKEARECFQRCVDVTPEMAREVIQACRKKSIDCIVAPYEADAQLAYLDKINMVQLIITEDSDLILFGCNRILFKMDGCGGGLLYEKENLPKSFGGKATKFSFEKFRYMCILSGCDYLPSLPGIGLAKACKFFTLTNNNDLSAVLSKLPSYLKMPKLVVSDEYKESFIKANNTFLYQLAFCPKEKRLVPINPYPGDINREDLEYAGKYLDDDLAYQLALGNINVKTLKEFDWSQNSPSFSESKSVVWGSDSIKQNCKPTKKENAFKFSTPIRKPEITQKRKFSELEDKDEISPSPTEDLFSQYSSKDIKKNKFNESYEEDPLISCSEQSDIVDSKNESISNSPDELKPSLKKIVKSRFFSSQSSQSSTESSQMDVSISSASPISKNEDFLGDVENPGSSPLVESPNQDDNKETVIVSVKTFSNKENVLNRFAKRKSIDIKSKSTADGDKNGQLIPKQESVLDVFSSEASSTTSTLSSMQKCAKILSQTIKDGSKIKPKSLFSKPDPPKKLVTTKINDFNFTKESVVKIDNAKKSINETFEKSPIKEIMKSPLKERFSTTETIMKSPLKGRSITTTLKSPLKGKSPITETILKSPLKDRSPTKVIVMESPSKEKSPTKEITIKSPLKEISPYFLNSSDEPVYCIASMEESDTVIVLSDCEDLDAYEVKSTKSSAKLPNKLQIKRSNKLSECRTIGLSKKRKSNPNISRKETLFNFNFTRQSAPVKSS